MVPRVFTDLRLHGSAPSRVQPEIGEWAPHEVMTTRAKKRSRVLAITAFVLITAALFAFGYWVFTLIQSSG